MTMSFGAPSTRDPQKDKKLINEIGVLANAEDVGIIWEKEGLKKANELASILDDSLIVSKNGGTINNLTDLREKLAAWKTRLEADENAILQGGTYAVLDKDIALIDERIVLLQDLGNPKEEFSIDQTGKFAFVDKVFQQIGSYDFSYKMDEKSFYRGGDRIKVGDYNNNQGVTITGPKGTLIVKIVGGEVIIEPMSLIDKRFSFTMTGFYQKKGTKHGLALTRRFVVDPEKSKPEETEEDLKNKLNDEQKERVEGFTDAEGLRIGLKYFTYGEFFHQKIEDYGSNAKNHAEAIFQFEQEGKIDQFEQKTQVIIRVFQEQMRQLGWTSDMISKFGNHPTWIYWHIAKNEYIDQNREEVSKDPSYAKYEEWVGPGLENNEKNDQFMIDTMIGWELIKRINDQRNKGDLSFFTSIATKNIELGDKINQLIQKLASNGKASSLEYGELGRAYRESFNVSDIVYAEEIPQFVKDILGQHGISEEEWNLLTDEEKKIMEETFKKINEIPDNEEKQRKINEIMSGLGEEIKKKKDGVEKLGDTLGTEEQPGTNENQIDDIDFEETIGDLKFQKADFSVKTAVVSDVESMFEERALHQAEEKLREDYEKLGKLGLFSNRRIGARLKMFLMRDFKRGKYMRSFMRQYAKSGTELLNPEMTAAAERHEKLLREFTTRSEGESNVKPIGEAVEVPEVNQLCKRYLTQVSPAVMTDDQFQTLFDEIIGRNPTLRARVGTMSKYRAGNILLHLRAEREYRSLVAKMERALESYVRSGNRDTYNTEVAVFVREYVVHTKNNVPDNIRFLMNAPENIERTKQWFSHEKGRLTLEAQNYRRKIDLVVGGTGAYAINNGDREQNPLARLGSKLKKSPYGPHLKMAGYATMTGVAFWSGSWVLPLLYGGTVYVARKVSDATEEQKGAEKRAVRGLDEQNTYYEKMHDIRQNTENYKGNIFQKARMKYQARRQVRLFGETTHREQMSDIHVTMQNLEQSLITGEMLQPRLIDALARIDLYHKTGHNFFAQQNDLKMEETLMQLYSLVQSGAKALRTTTEGLRAHADYGAQVDDLQNGYNDTLDLFKERRTKLGVRHAVGYTVTALVMRGLFSRMDIGGMKTMKLNQEVIDSFQLSDADVQHMETWLLSGKKSPEALWTEIKMLKVDTGLMIEGQFNTLKNVYAGAIEGGARGMMEHGELELLRNSTSLPISVTDSGHVEAIKFLSDHKIGVCLPTDGNDIFNALQKIQKTPSDIYSLDEDLRRKVGEYVYYFLKVGTDPKAGLLGAHMHEQKNRIPMILGALGLPLFNNTFLKEIKAEKEDEIIAPPERGTTPGMGSSTPGMGTATSGTGSARPVVPLGIVTDPKKHTIDHGVIGEDAVGGYNPSLVDTP